MPTWPPAKVLEGEHVRLEPLTLDHAPGLLSTADPETFRYMIWTPDPWGVEGFEEYVRLISQHKGGPAKITSAMGDPESPIMTKCQVLAQANARVIDRLRDGGALREDVETIQVCRLVGGIAAVADQGALDATAVRPMLEVVADGLLR